MRDIMKREILTHKGTKVEATKLLTFSFEELNLEIVSYKEDRKKILCVTYGDLELYKSNLINDPEDIQTYFINELRRNQKTKNHIITFYNQFI